MCSMPSHEFQLVSSYWKCGIGSPIEYVRLKYTWHHIANERTSEREIDTFTHTRIPVQHAACVCDSVTCLFRSLTQHFSTTTYIQVWVGCVWLARTSDIRLNGLFCMCAFRISRNAIWFWLRYAVCMMFHYEKKTQKIWMKHTRFDSHKFRIEFIYLFYFRLIFMLENSFSSFLPLKKLMEDNTKLLIGSTLIC